MLSFLAEGRDELCIDLAKDVRFAFSTSAVRFVSNVTYVVVDKQSREDLPDDDEEASALAGESENE